MNDEFTNSAVHYGPFKFTEMDRPLSQIWTVHFPHFGPKDPKSRGLCRKVIDIKTPDVKMPSVKIPVIKIRPYPRLFGKESLLLVPFQGPLLWTDFPGQVDNRLVK